MKKNMYPAIKTNRNKTRNMDSAIKTKQETWIQLSKPNKKHGSSYQNQTKKRTRLLS